MASTGRLRARYFSCDADFPFLIRPGSSPHRRLHSMEWIGKWIGSPQRRHTEVI